MPERDYNAGGYRFGFNGKENDNEVKGNGNSLDFVARIYDSRLGRWLSLEPMQPKFSFLSPFAFCANNPLIFVDPDGKTLKFYGERKELDKAEVIINNKFAGSNVTFAIGSDGISTLTGDKTTLNTQQLALYQALEKVIISKKTTNMYALRPTERGLALGGSFSGNKDKNGNEQSITTPTGKKNAQYIDVYDMEALDVDRNDGISAASDMIHEIYEAYMYQDQGVKDFEPAHGAALAVQAAVDGFLDVKNESFSNDPNNMYTTYTIGGGEVKLSVIEISNGNWTGKSTTSTVRPPLNVPKSSPVDNTSPSTFE